MANVEIHRAGLDEVDRAYELVQEYYEAASVVARDDRAEFVQLYFDAGSGFWLACEAYKTIGCIALRRLIETPDRAEVKRLYVRPAYRGRGVAAALYGALEGFARDYGYAWLYLDSTDEMIAAHRFYESQRYSRCERYNDNPQATIFMRKALVPGA
jgi:GNAT superfamily N-acetyltransferase